jgi:hypothetical protein
MLTPTPITELLMAASLSIAPAATPADANGAMETSTSQTVSYEVIEREKIGEDMIAICNQCVTQYNSIAKSII